MPAILYDISRLIARRNAATATGIDRVDLKYALHLLRAEYATTCYVAQMDGQLRLVPASVAESFLKNLNLKWFNESVNNAVQRDFSKDFFALGLLSGSQPVPNTDKDFKPRLTTKNYTDVASLPRKERLQYLMTLNLKKYLPIQLHWFTNTPKQFQKFVLFFVAVFPIIIRYMAAAPKEKQPAQTELPKVLTKNKIAADLNLYVRELQSQGHDITYINTSHHGLLDSELFIELKLGLKSKFIFYIHDIIPIDFPEYCRPGAKTDHERRIRNVIQVGSHLIFNSQDTKQRVISFANRNQLQITSNSVSYIGFDSSPATNTLSQITEEPYFIMLGTIEGRKNHLGMLQIWRDIISKTARPPKLIIVGKRGWCNEAVLDILDRCDAIKPFVVELNEIGDAHLFKLMRGARALLFPSFAEGWGMPVVEALNLGVPVICSNIQVFEEASQGLAEFISPLKLNEWADAVIDYAKVGSKRRELAHAKIETFKTPTWENMFVEMQKIVTTKSS